MQAEILLELPDEALYHLLVTMEVADVVRMRKVFGRRRQGVFFYAERYFQEKYHLPGLSLVLIDHIFAQESDDTSLREALRFGDYPEYAISLVLDQPFTLIDKALFLGREKTAIALHKKRPSDLNYFFVKALEYRRPKFLRYLLTLREFSAFLRKAILYRRAADEDIDWALTTIQPKVDERLIIYILGTMVYTPIFFPSLLALASDHDLLKAERVHQRSDLTDTNPLGGTDYYHGEEVSASFLEEREKRGL